MKTQIVAVLFVLGVSSAAAAGLCFASPFCLLTGRFCPPCITNPAPPAPTAAPVVNQAALAQFQADILSATNQKRAAECAGPVAQDAGLTAAAQAYANQLAASGSFAHSPAAQGGQYGENLAMQCGAPYSGPAAVQGWYNEKQFYNPANPQIVISGNMNGHYTALVWKSTTQMGCGSATSGSCTYIVCNYLQPGNNPGAVAQNVGCP